MLPLKFTIGIEPVTKKNHQQIARNKKTGAMFVVPSQAYKNYEYAAGYFLGGKGETIDEPVNVKAVYYMGSRKKVDISNLNSCLHDVLTKYGIIADDNMRIIVSTDGSRIRYDKNNPRTEVEITPASEEDIEAVREFDRK